MYCAQCGEILCEDCIEEEFNPFPFSERKHDCGEPRFHGLGPYTKEKRKILVIKCEQCLRNFLFKDREEHYGLCRHVMRLEERTIEHRRLKKRDAKSKTKGH